MTTKSKSVSTGVVPVGDGNGLVVDRPLNQTQVKNLTTIVEGDMANLQAKVKEDIDRRLRQRLTEIEAQYGATTGWEQWQAKYTKLADDFRKQIAAIEQQVVQAGFQASGPGITVTTSGGMYNASFWKREGADEAAKRVRNAAQLMNEAVARIVARETHKVKRAILLQSLPGGPSAIEILSDLPSADDLLELIRAELAEKDADLVAELL